MSNTGFFENMFSYGQALFKWKNINKNAPPPPLPEKLWLISYKRWNEEYVQVVHGTEEDAINEAKGYAKNHEYRHVTLHSTTKLGVVRTYPPTFHRVDEQ